MVSPRLALAVRSIQYAHQPSRHPPTHVMTRCEPLALSITKSHRFGRLGTMKRNTTKFELRTPSHQRRRASAPTLPRYPYSSLQRSYI